MWILGLEGLKTLLIVSLSNHNDNDGNKKIKKQHL